MPLLVVALGTPSVSAGRQQRTFLLGLGGAVIAIACAMALALILSDGIGP